MTSGLRQRKKSAARRRMLEAAFDLFQADGYEDATWILLDFDSVLAHVFLPGERSYYDLESLWAPAAKRRKRAAAG